MNQNPQADTIERHLEVNRQAAQDLVESVKECCQAAEKHLKPQEHKCKEGEARGNSS